MSSWGYHPWPADEAAAAFVARPIRVTLADQTDRATHTTRQRRPFSQLAPPAVVNPGVAFHGPGVRLTDPVSANRLNRRAPKSHLSPPAVTGEAPSETLIGGVAVQLAYSRRGKPKSRLAAPRFDIQPNFQGGVAVQLAPSFRGRPKSRLRPPAVVTAAPTGIFFGPDVHATYSRRPVAKPRLPKVIYAARVYAPISAHLAYSRRGKPSFGLGEPVVIGGARVNAPVSVTLAPSFRGKAKPFLRRPTDLVDRDDLGIVRTHLAYSRRGVAHSFLRAPRVVNAVTADAVLDITLARIRPAQTIARLSPPPSILGVDEAFYGPATSLAYSLRGKPKSHLPQVVYAARVYAPISGYLAKPRDTTPPTHSFLRDPIDVAARDDLVFLQAHLAYSRRGTPKSRLKPPTVVAPVLARAISVALAYSLRGKPKPRLIPPTVVAPVLARPIDTNLARIRPARTQARLSPPSVITPANPSYGPSVTLAYSKRGRPLSGLGGPRVLLPNTAFPQGPMVQYVQPPRQARVTQSRLFPPTTVDVVEPLARPVDTTLARIRPVGVLAILRRPADLVDRDDLGFVRVALAYSLRGRAKSVLRRPVVVAPVLARPISTTLVRITPPPVLSVLRKPVVIDLRPQAYYLDLHLAYSRRGAPKSFLRPASLFTPQPKAETVVAVTLAYSLRGKPKSVLRRPVVVTPATPYLRPVEVTLAPQRRGKPKPRLAPPVVVARFVARPIRVELAPQRRGIPKSRLPRVIYAARVYAPISVSLAPSSRLAKRTHSRLSQPTVVRAFVASPTRVTLVTIRPHRTIHILVPPAVLAVRFVARDIQATLVRIRPFRTIWSLRPPVVVGEPEQVYNGPTVTLTYSRRDKPFYFLNSVLFYECYGTVTGEDTAATVCGVTSAATVEGTTSAATVTGSTSAATVEGTTSSRGTVTGGDTPREGC